MERQVFRMAEWFSQLHPAYQALIGGSISWGMTAIGASVVFFFREIKESVMRVMLGFAAGVMIAASFWSLLAPAIEFAGAVVNSVAGSSYWLFTWRCLSPAARSRGPPYSFRSTQRYA